MTKTSVNFPVNSIRTIYPVKSIDDLIKLTSIHEGKNIKVLGTDHSWSGCAYSNDDIYIRLDFLDTIEMIDDNTVRIGGGVTIKNLVKFLKKKNKTLLNMGTIREQRVVGAILTGTHGSGIKASLTSHVKEIVMLTFKENKIPQIFYIKKGNKLFDTCILSLGSGGFVTSVDLEVTDLFNIKEEKKMITYEEFVNRDKEEDFKHYDMYYVNPYKETFIHVKRRKTDLEISKKFKLMFWITNNFYTTFLDIIFKLNRHRISIMPLIDKTFSSGKIIGPSHDVLSNLAKRVPVTDIEFYIHEDILLDVLKFIYFYFQSLKESKKINNNYDSILSDLELNMMFNYLLKYKFTSSLYLSIRMVDESTATISPHRNHKYYNIDFEYQTIYQTDQYMMTFYRVFHDVMVKHFGCKPHWAKNHFLTSHLTNKLYNQNAIDFMNDINYLDKNEILYNDYIHRSFIDKSLYLFDIDFYHKNLSQLEYLFNSASSIQDMKGYYKVMFLKRCVTNQTPFNMLRKIWKFFNIEWYGRYFKPSENDKNGENGNSVNKLIPYIKYKNNLNKKDGWFWSYTKINNSNNDFIIKYRYSLYNHIETYRQVDNYNILCETKINKEKFFILLTKF